MNPKDLLLKYISETNVKYYSSNWFIDKINKKYDTAITLNQLRYATRALIKQGVLTHHSRKWYTINRDAIGNKDV